MNCQKHDKNQKNHILEYFFIYFIEIQINIFDLK